MDVTAAAKMESPHGGPLPERLADTIRDIRAADELRESALQAYNIRRHPNALREHRRQAYGLDIHNITDAAAERGATHWNNDPPAPDADPDDAGNYLRLRFDRLDRRDTAFTRFSRTRQGSGKIHRPIRPGQISADL